MLALLHTRQARRRARRRGALSTHFHGPRRTLRCIRPSPGPSSRCCGASCAAAPWPSPAMRVAVEERFGRYRRSSTAWRRGSSDPDARLVWIHAVSLGETRAAAHPAGRVAPAAARHAPAAHARHRHRPRRGRQAAAARRPAGLAALGHARGRGTLSAPVPPAHRRPDGNRGLAQPGGRLPRERGIPLVLANARLNDKSLRQAQRLAWLARPAYAALAAVWAQTEADARACAVAGRAGAGRVRQPQVRRRARCRASWPSGQQLRAHARHARSCCWPAARDGEEPCCWKCSSASGSSAGPHCACSYR